MHVRDSISFKVRRELFEERGSRLEYTFFGSLYYSLGDPERNLLKKLEESIALSRLTVVRKNRSSANVEREIELPISKQCCARSLSIDRSINRYPRGCDDFILLPRTLHFHSISSLDLSKNRDNSLDRLGYSEVEKNKDKNARVRIS